MSQKTLNFNSKQILSKEELMTWDESLRELIGNVLRYSRTSSQIGGILDVYDVLTSAFINDFFKVSIGSVPSGGYDTLKIGEGRGVLNIENTTAEYVAGLVTNNVSLQNQLVSLFKWKEKDNINVSGISGYVDTDVVYVGFIPKYNPLEDGLCNISANNQVTITGGSFMNLRGQSTKNPTKVRFFTEAGAVAVNSGIYEVIAVNAFNQIIISGNLTAESNVKLMNVGSFDLSAQGSLSDKYSYVTANGELTFTKVAADITSVGGFIICSLLFGPAGAFSIVDRRSDYLFGIGNSLDAMLKSVAQTVSGAKTFVTNSPIFNVPTIDKSNSSSFITPLQIGTVTPGVLVIPNNGGNIFKIKGVAGNITLNRIQFDSSYVANTKIGLYVDPTGLDFEVTISAPSVANKLITANPLGISGVAGTLLKGSLIELWADDNLDWHIIGDSFVKATEPLTWVPIMTLYDGNMVALDPNTNSVEYLVDGEMVYLQLNTFAATASPITFDIPAAFAPQQNQVARTGLKGTNGSISVFNTGAVALSFSSALGNTYNQIVYHL